MRQVLKSLSEDVVYLSFHSFHFWFAFLKICIFQHFILQACHVVSLLMTLLMIKISCLRYWSDIFQTPVLQTPNQAGPYMDPKWVLLYFYYGGLIYAVLGRYEEAFVMMQKVSCMPAVAVSAIMVQAYKVVH